MSIVFTTSTNMDEKGVRGMTLASTPPLTTAQPVDISSVSFTGKSTARFSSIREFIHWLALGLFLGCALNMNAEVTEYKSGKQWHCVEKECTNGKKTVSLADAPGSSSRTQPPSEIYVDGDTYSLKIKDVLGPKEKGRTLVGTTTVATHEIEIKSGQKLEDEKDSVLHELIHSAFGSSTDELLNRKWSEEQATYKLTPKLLRIIRDNPRLLEYLTQP